MTLSLHNLTCENGRFACVRVSRRNSSEPVFTLDGITMGSGKVSCTGEYRPGGGGGGVLRFGSDGGVPLKPPNLYPSLRVILAEKGTHY